MRTTIISVALAISSAAVACTGAPPSEEVESGESMVISDVVEMVRRPDGSFDVTCRGANGAPNYTEIATGDDVLQNKVCAGGAPDAAAPDASSPAPVDDPFEPASCTGQPMTLKEAQARFVPGTASASLGSFTLLRRTQICNPQTGCGPWSAPTTVFDGNASLRVENGERIVPVFQGPTPDLVCSSFPNNETRCSAIGKPLECGAFGIGWERRISITCPTCPKECVPRWLTPGSLEGTITASCARLTATGAVAVDSQTGNRTVAQLALLVRY